jgi:hypothetical protein
MLTLSGYSEACERNGAPEGRRHRRLQATENLWEIGRAADPLSNQGRSRPIVVSTTARALVHLFSPDSAVAPFFHRFVPSMGDPYLPKHKFLATTSLFVRP